MVEATAPSLKGDGNSLKAAACQRIRWQEWLPPCTRAQLSTRLALTSPLRAEKLARIKNAYTILLVVRFGEQGVSLFHPHCLQRFAVRIKVVGHHGVQRLPFLLLRHCGVCMTPNAGDRKAPCWLSLPFNPLASRTAPCPHGRRSHGVRRGPGCGTTNGSTK